MSLLSLSGALLLAGCATQALAEPKVLSVPFTKTAKQNNVAKRDPAAATLNNSFQRGLYSVQVQVGTPAQTMTLQVDTGSSDIWFFSPEACQESRCINGTFDPTRSSTYNLVEEGTFNITYADQSGATGNYITDTITLGNNLTVSNQTMALATAAQDNTFGLFGIGFAADEAPRTDGASRSQADYSTFVDSLVSNGVIETYAYSLWLDDLESSTGTILFGGYDPDQWTGPLTVLPILPDFDYVIEADQERVVSFTVDLSMVALTDASGRTTILNQAEFPVPAVLDSGTTLTEVPSDTFIQLANYFGAVPDREGNFVVNCDIANWRGTLDYGFGGAGGAIIQVPFSEIAIRQGNETGGFCQFGLEPANTGTVLLGDTMLRSAYVIYDLDSEQIAIAQSAWNSTTSNPRAIAAGSDLASIQGARNSTGTVPLRQYTSLINAETSIPANAFNTRPATSTIAGVQTTLNVAPVSAPAATGSRTSSAGGAIQTAAMMLPMALPLAAALL